ncbi:hypothetical protein J6590_092285 [Homalodisca vitripennis]|nr:hypothetical protein J6590_092285 [Homalodisca vitripennis]
MNPVSSVTRQRPSSLLTLPHIPPAARYRTFSALISLDLDSVTVLKLRHCEYDTRLAMDQCNALF